MMTSQPVRSLLAKNRLRLAYCLPLIIGMPGLWGLFLARWLGGFDLFNRVGNPPESIATYALIASLGTAILSIWCYARVDQALGLVSRGVEVTGRITKLGTGPKDLLKVHYTYDLDQASYVGVFDATKQRARQLQVQGTVQLLVDSRYPGRSSPKEDVFPHSSAGGSTVTDQQ